MKNFSKLELTLIAEFLKVAKDELGKHGCNDYSLPNTQENVDLLNAMEQHNVGPGNEPDEVYVYDPSAKKLDTMDFCIAGYLSALAAEAAKKMLTPLQDNEEADIPLL